MVSHGCHNWAHHPLCQATKDKSKVQSAATSRHSCAKQKTEGPSTWCNLAPCIKLNVAKCIYLLLHKRSQKHCFELPEPSSPSTRGSLYLIWIHTCQDGCSGCHRRSVVEFAAIFLWSRATLLYGQPGFRRQETSNVANQEPPKLLATRHKAVGRSVVQSVDLGIYIYIYILNRYICIYHK